MKTRLLILFLSLTINFVLVLALTRPPVRTVEQNWADHGEFALPSRSSANLAVSNAVLMVAPFRWREIESDDYHQYVANLKAVNCPEETIRDIIVADIEELYATRLRSAPSNVPIWLNADRRRIAQRHENARKASVRAEKRALVKELIGYEWDNRANEVWNEDTFVALLLGFLPDSKPPQLIAILDKYLEQAQDVKTAANHILIDEDKLQLHTLYDNLLAEVSMLITPAEFLELQLRVQAGVFLPARNVTLHGFKMTGAELREYIRLAKACDDPFKDEFLGHNPSEEELAGRRTDFEAQLEKSYDKQRFADYRRSQDPEFREALSFAKDENLSETSALRIYSIREDTEIRAQEILQDGTLSAMEKADALRTLKKTSASSISSTLGSAYSNYLAGPGHWLELLVPGPEFLSSSNVP